MNRLFKRRCVFLVLVAVSYASVLAARADLSVSDAMDSVVTRLYGTMTPDQLDKLDDAAVRKILTEDEKKAFATKFWEFDVNVPVVVSVMHEVTQAVTPFWLADSGFKKTEMRVRNEEMEFEVWQKAFNAGHIGLGVNGFDKHRPQYFVCVGPQQADAKVELTHFSPAGQKTVEMRVGATTYHDWTELVLTKVPDELKGQVLLQTIRGRAREAHLIGAFRRTPYPSSDKADQVVLTWSDEPRTTQTIQWRTNTTVDAGIVRYREKNVTGAAWIEAAADKTKIEDRLLANDRYIHHFTATLTGLKPATAYEYTVGPAADVQRTAPSEFITAPEGPAPFTFVWMSDTHNAPESAKTLASILERDPKTAFLTISGDLVGTGQYRDDWDKLIGQSSEFFRQRPLAPSMGNHDTIDGLGAGMYLGLFGLPTNGAKKVEPERSYSFRYGNALFLVLDATAVVEDQTAWLEEQLARTDATWKFAIFHFPPYAPDDDYPDIRREWCALFDKYHVDFVLAGHVHYYERTYPLKDGKRVNAPADGTVYLITVAVKGRPRRERKPDYAEVVDFSGTPLYQVFTIDGNRLVTRSCDQEGKVRDELVVQK
ncbi:MAG: metallophosphoesterase family protein [Candidatus Hydrogenedentes bacterium]|nr:metallophosphoesterase family protein [Candidatus Hydrogenedentota bacterium]